MKILFVYRSKLLKMFSIENCFDIIKSEFPQSVSVVKCFVPIERANLFSIIKNSLYVRKIQKEQKCDVVHITGDVHYSNLFLAKKQVVLTIHDVRGINVYKGVKKFLYMLFWIWLPVIKSQKVISISKFTSDEINAVCPIVKEKINFIPDPVNSMFKFCPKEFYTVKPRILMIGTIFNKNIERAIKALKEINCFFNIIGKLSEEQVALLKQNNIEYENEYGLNNVDMLVRYQKSDIVLFPSTYEGFGMIIIEAQAIGRPVVTSDLEPMVEVSGNAACLVNPYDINSIREGVLRVINDSDYRSMLIEMGLENARKYQSDRIASMYLDVYKEIIEGNN